MRFKVLFKLYDGVRHTGVKNIYRPDWCLDNKLDFNCGQIISSDLIELGKSYECELQPLCPEFWKNVRLNDILRCMEGSRQVGEATVLEILE